MKKVFMVLVVAGSVFYSACSFNCDSSTENEYSSQKIERAVSETIAETGTIKKCISSGDGIEYYVFSDKKNNEYVISPRYAYLENTSVYVTGSLNRKTVYGTWLDITTIQAVNGD